MFSFASIFKAKLELSLQPAPMSRLLKFTSIIVLASSSFTINDEFKMPSIISIGLTPYLI
ncbi:hypothetical protein BVRB_2g043080 [Beta vulgaris subsp. vulgaris]|nr:hypothetical protein BVRB_2g043080 [Beta vulgaris subsp. vulgaris]